MIRFLVRAASLAAFLVISTVCISAQSVSGNLGNVTKGKAAKATVYLTIPGGLHANSHNPNSEYAIPTVVKASSTKGVKIGAVSYPRGKNRKFAFSDTPLNVYEGRVPFTFTVNVPPSFSGSSVKVNVS